MKRLLPMQSLLTLGEGDELKGLESCEEKLGGAVVGTMDGSFWVPCIITGTGWAKNGKTWQNPALMHFPMFFLGGGSPIDFSNSRVYGDWRPKKTLCLGINFITS